MKKEKKCINKELVVDLLVVAIILSGLIPIVTVTAQQTVVSIPDASAKTGETVTVPINITNAAGLGAATIWLSYDKDVVIVNSVSDGNLGSIIAGNTSGVTKMSWFSATGKTGDFVFAYVTLNATGSAEDTSELNLTVKKLVDTGNNPIAHTVDEGMFTVGEVTLTSVTVESKTVAEGENTTINVTLSDTPAAGVGAYGFNITFDPFVVQVKEVTNLPGFGIPNWNNDTGWVVLGGAVYPGVGDGIFGTITFEAIGAGGTSTTLAMTVDDLKDEDNNPITYTVTDGLVTVSGPQPTPTSTPSPTPSPTLTPEVTPTLTPSETETPSPSLSPTSMPAVTPTATPTVTPAPSPTPTPTPPGFEAVFAIAGLLAVAYLVLRRR